MATKRICSVDRCDKRHMAGGYCREHYDLNRRKGSPHAKKIRGEPLKFIKETAMLFKGDECLIWPFNRNKRHGRGQINYQGKSSYAHRVTCELVYGPPPEDRPEAAHSCGNGHLGCINPHHLRWASKTENEADKVVHGTSNRGARHASSKLSEQDVRDIRKLCAQETQTEVARRYGISPVSAHLIFHRKSWAWLD